MIYHQTSELSYNRELSTAWCISSPAVRLDGCYGPPLQQHSHGMVKLWIFSFCTCSVWRLQVSTLRNTVIHNRICDCRPFATYVVMALTAAGFRITLCVGIDDEMLPI